MTSEFDTAKLLGLAKLTQSQREFIENEPADLLRGCRICFAATITRA